MPNGSVITALPLALIAASSLILAAGRPFRITRVPIALAIFAGVMVMLGTASYYATRFLFPSYYAPIESALLLTAIGLCACTFGVAIVRRFPKPVPSQWQWDRARLDIVILVLLAISVIGTFAAIKRIGYVPILRGDIREERLSYATQLGILFTMSVMGIPAMILAGVRRFAFGKSKMGTIALFVGPICSALYGPRFFPVLGIATTMVLYDHFRRRLPLWRLLVTGGIAVPLLVGVAVYREADLSVEAPLVTLSYLSFGEFRDFAWSLQYYEDPSHRVHGETIPGAIVPLLPGKVWSVVGVDKASLYERNSAQLMAELMKVEVGIRIGLVGELFMNFGTWGVVIGMLLLGLLIGSIDVRLVSASLTAPAAPFFALVAVLCVFALVGQLNMFTSSISVFGYPMLVAFLAAGRLGDHHTSSPIPEDAHAHVAVSRVATNRA